MLPKKRRTRSFQQYTYIYRLYIILQCTLNLQVISCFIYLLTNTGCLSPSSTICMSAHETVLNTFETSVVGRAVSPCKTCVHSSKNHDPARKCDRLYTLLYLKHDQIHISIAYRCIQHTEHFNFYLFNQTPLCTSQSCFYPLAKGAFAGLTRAWVENKSLTVCGFCKFRHYSV